MEQKLDMYNPLLSKIPFKSIKNSSPITKIVGKEKYSSHSAIKTPELKKNCFPY